MTLAPSDTLNLHILARSDGEPFSMGESVWAVVDDSDLERVRTYIARLETRKPAPPRPVKSAGPPPSKPLREALDDAEAALRAAGTPDASRALLELQLSRSASGHYTVPNADDYSVRIEVQPPGDANPTSFDASFLVEDVAANNPHIEEALGRFARAALQSMRNHNAR